MVFFVSSIKRISLSVPAPVSDDLNYVHRRIGVSKSALVSLLLGGGLSDLRELLESLPDAPSPDDVLRFRGASADKAQARIDVLRCQLERGGA